MLFLTRQCVSGRVSCLSIGAYVGAVEASASRHEERRVPYGIVEHLYDGMSTRSMLRIEAFPEAPPLLTLERSRLLLRNAAQGPYPAGKTPYIDVESHERAGMQAIRIINTVVAYSVKKYGRCFISMSLPEDRGRYGLEIYVLELYPPFIFTSMKHGDSSTESSSLKIKDGASQYILINGIPRSLLTLSSWISSMDQSIPSYQMVLDNFDDGAPRGKG